MVVEEVLESTALPGGQGSHTFAPGDPAAQPTRFEPRQGSLCHTGVLSPTPAEQSLRPASPHLAALPSPLPPLRCPGQQGQAPPVPGSSACVCVHACHPHDSPERGVPALSPPVQRRGSWSTGPLAHSHAPGGGQSQTRGMSAPHSRTPTGSPASGRPQGSNPAGTLPQPPCERSAPRGLSSPPPSAAPEVAASPEEASLFTL